ncbi:4'-phosphopantetheinyl transferase [Marmoricola endophyticus]|uniref:4'-phosphopantetheinyl transferase n=1 Tax=Marmoricola endophyticus TaxID=2040280 RepID=A0A917F4F1_9ACTN|nr:4'-phosphopantetheinyl transferase superfamily protein [Marmoricola endophyticus]GGF47521.1 4'-phosphopantetheinyl transferase [Marmoricola endophyticus]
MDEPVVAWADARSLGPADAALLSPAEARRAERYRRPEDRAARTAAAVLLRRTLARATGADPRTVEVTRRCPLCRATDHGRPEAPGTGLHLSVTHCGSVVGVALAATAAGLDVEHPRRFADPAIAGEVLGEEEHAASPAELCRTWVRKEAVVKATGDGITVGLRGVRVTAADEPAALLSYPGPLLALRLRDVPAPEGYVASLAELHD